MTPSHILLKDLLVEMPQIGHVLKPEVKAALQKVLTVKLNDHAFLSTVKTTPLQEAGFFFVSGQADGPWSSWCALFHEHADHNELCFASGQQQTNWNIENCPTFSVHVSARYTPFPKRAASTAYLRLAASGWDGKPVVLTSSSHLSDEGCGVWRELLTRPDLHDEVFVWNLKEKRRETVLDWSDVFGHEDRYTDLVVALKTPPKT